MLTPMILVYNENSRTNRSPGFVGAYIDEEWVQGLASARNDLIYFFMYVTTDDELFTEVNKYSAAMDDYARHTTPGGTWYCLPEELNEPCPLDTHCPVHDD